MKTKKPDELTGQRNRSYILPCIILMLASSTLLLTPHLGLVNVSYNSVATLSLLLVSAEQLHQTLGQTKLKLLLLVLKWLLFYMVIKGIYP